MGAETTTKPTGQIDDDQKPDDIETEDVASEEPGDGVESSPSEAEGKGKTADPYAGLNATEREYLEIVKRSGVTPTQLVEYAAEGFDSFQKKMKEQSDQGDRKNRNDAAAGEDDIVPFTRREAFDLAKKIGETTPRYVDRQLKEYKLEALIEAHSEISDDDDASDYVRSNARKMMAKGTSPKDAFRAAHKRYLDWEGRVKQKSLAKKIANQKTRGDSARGSAATEPPKMDFAEYKDEELTDDTAIKRAMKLAQEFELARK